MGEGNKTDVIRVSGARFELEFWRGIIRNVNSMVALVRKYKIDPLVSIIQEDAEDIEITQQSEDHTVKVFRIRDNASPGDSTD